jgi:hypothetical protein
MVIEFGTAAPPPKSPVVWDGGYNTTSLGLQQKAYNNNNNTLTSITDPTHNTPAAAAMATTASAFGYENFFFSMKGSVKNKLKAS